MDAILEDLIRAGRKLSPAQRQALIRALNRETEIADSRHDITELEGLGKDLWQGVDADEYIRRERESWERKTG